MISLYVNIHTENLAHLKILENILQLALHTCYMYAHLISPIQMRSYLVPSIFSGKGFVTSYSNTSEPITNPDKNQGKKSKMHVTSTITVLGQRMLHNWI